MGYAFISYSSKNQGTADAFRQFLQKNNIKAKKNDLSVILFCLRSIYDFAQFLLQLFCRLHR